MNDGRPRWVLKVSWKESSGKASTAARRFLFRDEELRQEIPMPCGCTQMVECSACLQEESERTEIPCRNHKDQFATVEIRRLK